MTCLTFAFVYVLSFIMNNLLFGEQGNEVGSTRNIILGSIGTLEDILNNVITRP